MYDQLEIASDATDRLVLVGLAIVLEAMLGRLSWLFRFLPHPARLLWRMAAGLGRRLDRRERGRPALLIRGAIVTVFLCGAAAAAGVALSIATAPLRFGWIADGLLLVLLIAQRGAYGDSAKTMRALSRDGLDAARERVSMFHHGIAGTLDEHGICRALCEHLARSFGRRVVGPIFWYLLLGVPGLLAYEAILATSGALGRDAAQRNAFGWTAGRLEAGATWLPGRLAGLLVAAAAFLAPTARPMRAFRIMASQAGRLSPAGFGWPAAALAGALSIEIGGPNAIDGKKSPWVGEGTARATPRDVRRALILFVYAGILQAAAIVGLAAVALYAG